MTRPSLTGVTAVPNTSADHLGVSTYRCCLRCPMPAASAYVLLP